MTDCKQYRNIITWQHNQHKRDSDYEAERQ